MTYDVQHRWMTYHDGLELESESAFSCDVSGSGSGPICLSSSSSILSFALTTCHKEEKEYHSQENNSDQFLITPVHKVLSLKTCTTILEDSIETSTSIKTKSFKLFSLQLQWDTSTSGVARSFVLAGHLLYVSHQPLGRLTTLTCAPHVRSHDMSGTNMVLWQGTCPVRPGLHYATDFNTIIQYSIFQDQH